MAVTWRKLVYTDSPTFTGTVTAPVIKLTTGAGAGKVLVSDADGDASWASTIPANQVLIPGGIGTPTYDDMQDFLNMTQASGRLTGGVLTASATEGAVDISAMEMMVHTANTLGSPLIYFKKAAVADLVLTTNPGVNYIWATYSSAGGGTITYSANAARPTEDYNVFVIGRCYRNGALIATYSASTSDAGAGRIIIHYSVPE